METIEEKLKRLIWDNQANGEEFFRLFGEMERAGETRMRLFRLLRESIYAGNEEAKAFFMKQIRRHGLSACGEVDTLCAAAYMDDVAMIRRLVEMGCEVNTHGQYYNAFPLAAAASACRLAAVKELLRMGAEATMHHSYALFAACQAPEQESSPVEKVAPVVKELLDAGACPIRLFIPHHGQPCWRLSVMKMKIQRCFSCSTAVVCRSPNPSPGGLKVCRR